MNKKLDNVYVERYYDTQVANIGGSYTDERWHSSVVKEFEYQQTARAIRSALSGRQYKKVIEIGPGDGVWTSLIKETVSGAIHLVEQSGEMLSRAKERFSSLRNITFEHSDFLTSHPPADNDLIVAIRCFEYFEDKEGALEKMRDLLTRDGRIVIITKNADLVTSSSVQHKTLHSDQVSRRDMQHLAIKAGLVIEKIYPAVIRWKASYTIMRFLFDFLHKMTTWSQGIITIPFLETYATESYVYIFRTQK